VNQQSRSKIPKQASVGKFTSNRDATLGRPQRPEDLSTEDISATFPDQAPNQVAKFWIESLDRQTIRRLRFSPTPVDLDPRLPCLP